MELPVNLRNGIGIVSGKRKCVVIGEKPLTLNDIHHILYKNYTVELSLGNMDKVFGSYQFLKEFSSDKIIYGINTGFGPMAQYKVSESEKIQLQLNLIRSHCSGSGNAVNPLFVKALLVDRLNTFCMGLSGVHPDTVYLLQTLINENITPVVYEHGGVGASGDLVQLAHIALTMVGEGEVHYKGKIYPTKEIFAKKKIKPLKIRIREGLALMNGTSAMTGLGAINILKAKNLLHWSIFISAVLQEIFKSFDDHFSAELNDAKLHEGQQAVAAAMRHFVADSVLLKKRSDHLYYRKPEENHFKEKIQEYYSLRCVPQVLGPVWETIEHAEKTIVNELNSVSDNPIVDAAAHNIHHGGNFHGDYVALEMDKLKIAITKLSMLAERQLNYMLNDKLNNVLPPFINLAKIGVNFGMQGVQFSATSTVAENQTLASPMYIHSIPNNNDNQDIVSMGFNAAMLTNKVIENSYEVLAIELLAALHAIEYLGIENKISQKPKEIIKKLKTMVSKPGEDAPRYQELRKIKQFIAEMQLNV
jgi:histidine ammonia-lyase